MRPATARAALRPTARALRWAPTIAVAAAAVGAAWLAGAAGERSVAPIAAGVLATVVVAALHDPVDDLLAAVPTGRLARRVLRLALVGVVVVPAAAIVDMIGSGPSAIPPLAALTTAGLAFATWLRPWRAPAAAAVPAVWLAAALWLDALPAPLHDATTWWLTHPWQVAAVAGAAVALGRHR